MTNLDYDIETRILRGEIVWPTTYFRSKTWEYEIEFDICFKKIINGSIDKYNEEGELFDCYPLCDPALPDQDFKLKVETTEQSLLTKKKSGFNEKFFNEIDETQDYLFALNNASKQSKLFGFKLSNLDAEKSDDYMQIKLVRLQSS